MDDIKVDSTLGLDVSNEEGPPESNVLGETDGTIVGDVDWLKLGKALCNSVGHNVWFADGDSSGAIDGTGLK